MSYVEKYRLPQGRTRRYRAFGLEIESEVPIPGFLDSAADAPPDIRFHLGLPPDLPGEPTLLSGEDERRILRYAKDLFGVCFSDETEFIFDGSGERVWTTWVSPYTVEDMATYLQGPILGLLMQLRGLTPLHGSCVRIGGRAAAFLGPAGAGKSTTAAAFAERGFSVMSEDVVATYELDGKLMVRPGYPHIRLWPASADIVVGDRQLLEPITPNWTKLDYPLHGKYSRDDIRLGRIYLLAEREGGPRAPRLEPVPSMEAMLETMRNRYVRKLLDPSQESGDFRNISRMMALVDVRRVVASDDPARLDALVDLVAADFC